MTTIPASEIDQVTPSVLGAGGSALSAIAVVLSTSTRVPIGQVAGFSSGLAVTNFFGPGSTEDVVANGASGKGSGYFGGFSGSNKLPASILFTQYNQAAVAAYLRGGNAAAALTLAQLQALTGSLTAVIDGYSHVISSISLASYTSFSAAAAGIQAAFTDPTEASFTAAIGAVATGTAGSPNTKLVLTAVTGLVSVGDTVAGTGITAGTTILSQDTGGTPGGAGTYNLSAANTASSAAVNITSNVLNVTADTDHTISAGQTVTGSTVAAGTLITGQLGGTVGGIGTYKISGAPQQIASEAMTGVATAPLVTFDSISGAFVITSGITGAPSTAAFATGTLAAPLLLTSATGAVLSQGAAAAVPAAFMNNVVAQNTAWVTFMTAFDPDGGTGNSVKQAFAAWKNSQNNRFAYVCFDTDVSPTTQVPATSSLGYILTNNQDSGTCLIYEPSDLNLASFICGAAASIDFEETNGRITFAFKSQAGLVASVSNQVAADNLAGSPQGASRGNGYNFYGAYAAAQANFIWFQRGFVTGPFLWLDSYINQIVMNNAFQNDLLELQANSKSIPYSTSGANLIEGALSDSIAQFLNFGAFGPGDISSSQAAAVKAAAGVDITTALETQGYYLQIKTASAAARSARTTPPATFWYLDRGSIQSINLASVALL